MEREKEINPTQIKMRAFSPVWASWPRIVEWLRTAFCILGGTETLNAYLKIRCFVQKIVSSRFVYL